MKILMYTGSLSRGGAERVMCTLAGHLSSKGHAVVLATIYEAEDEYRLPPGVKRVFTEPGPSLLTGNRVRNLKVRMDFLKKVISDESPDVVLSFMGKNNLMALNACSSLGIPCVVSVRALPELEYYTFPMRISARFLFPKALAVVFQTEYASRFFGKKVRDRSFIIKNPIAPEFLGEIRKAPSAHPHILTAGRLDENKETSLIIKAFAAISGDFPDAVLTVCGDGPLRGELERQSEDLGMKDRISFAGSVSDMAGYYNEADIFVMMSDTEGMPNALIEAMSMGCACISTDCPAGAPAEFIDDGKTGCLIPVRDEKALQEKLRILASDRDKAFEMGQEASKSIRALLDRDKILRQWEEVLLS